MSTDYSPGPRLCSTTELVWGRTERQQRPQRQQCPSVGVGQRYGSETQGKLLAQNEEHDYYQEYQN